MASSLSLRAATAWRWRRSVECTPRHRSVAFASIYATSAPAPRSTRGDAATYLERLELVLRLAHVGLEEGERAELLDPVARVPIYRIVPFMDLDAA